MDQNSTIRLSQAVRQLNVGSTTIVDYLHSKNFTIDNNPNVKLTSEQYKLLEDEFQNNAIEKTDARQIKISPKTVTPVSKKEVEPKKIEKKETIIPVLQGTKSIGKLDIKSLSSRKEVLEQKSRDIVTFEKEKDNLSDKKNSSLIDSDLNPSRVDERLDISASPLKSIIVKESEKIIEQISLDEKNQPLELAIEIKEDILIDEKPKVEKINFESKHKLQGLTFIGRMDIVPEKPKQIAKFEYPKKSDSVRPSSTSSSAPKPIDKKVRQRINTPTTTDANSHSKDKSKSKEFKPVQKKVFVTEQEVQDKLKATLAKLNNPKSKESSKVKFRKLRRQEFEQTSLQQAADRQEELKNLKISEFASPSDIASLIDKPVNDIISTCVSLGIVVSINQRLDAEVIAIIADEFGYKAEFVDSLQETDDDVDNIEDLLPRPPIVTIMGHVDHGKTSLLDFIQNLNVVKSEAGGITQHIGAYDVVTKEGEKIAFLDTPGHEAFTAMRARGAKITDIVVIVVAADDGVMPQTKEAISHAQAAGVPIIVAINKIDKPTANVEKIKEQLSAIGILVEDWGGKYQCECISAKTGLGVDKLLHKILLEAEILDLKANPNRPARGTVLEASLEKGRGYMSTVMVQKGTLRIGDPVLVGAFFGKVKAMKNHLGITQKMASPSMPVQIMGIEGAPQAGDILKVMPSEREAREIATRRQQMLREQNIRVKKHITLDEIGRRLAIGSFQELNIIVKGDVDGSVEALSDSLIKLTTAAFKLNVIYKAVGAISESDVLLASAADAIIVGFQVRPSKDARELATKEGIDIRLYSIIYDAIENIRDAMQGMLAPSIQENITATVTVREIFKIPKVGTIAGSYVTTGCIKRSHKVRLIRDGIVLFTGKIDQLKRFKEDVKEVKHSFECGISLQNFTEIKVGDTIEAFEEVEVEGKL